ncbi:hypothetical protein ABT115_04955 [Streptomyces sp. NPDC001832]|uniref:hypothetical protein n=1 Tax=Streptomyces sp. NPDC001832 TaxID=3154527 RepID=UPI003331AF3B
MKKWSIIRILNVGILTHSDVVKEGLTGLLADQDYALLVAHVENAVPRPHSRLGEGLLVQVGQVLVHPVFFGPAIRPAHWTRPRRATGSPRRRWNRSWSPVFRRAG